MPERVVDGLEVVDVDEQDRGLAAVELLAHALHEQRAVREVRERVVVGLVVELVLQGLKLVDGLLEAVVLERDGRVVGQRLQQAQVVGAEGALEAHAVGEHDRADRALLAGEHGDHRVADAAGLHLGAQVRGAEGRGEADDGRVGVDEAGELLGDGAVGGLHRHAVVAGAVRRAQRLAVGGEQQDLGDVGVEGLEAAGEQRLERLGDLGGAGERAVRVVEELEPLMALALGDVGAVDGEHGQRGDQQHRDGARVGGDHERGGDRDARVDQRDERVRGEHLDEHLGLEVALGDGDRSAEQQDRERAAGERRGVQADPGLGLQGVGFAGDEVQHPRGERRGERELGEVEEELDDFEAADQAPDERGAEQRAEHERVAGREHEAEDERQVGEAERVRAAAEADVDDADLGGREPERHGPPRQVRLRVRGRAVRDQRPAGSRRHGERCDVEPNEDLARRDREAARAAESIRPSSRSSATAGGFLTGRAYDFRMARLIRMDHTGHTTLAEWATDDPASADAAATALRSALDEGYYAVVTSGEGQATQVTELPADAELVILRRPIAGG